jgi:hypothetical protein
MSDVAQLMRAANPVPESVAALPNDEFDALLLLTQSRSGNVDIQELTKPVEPEKKKQFSGWLVAAAAFAVVIVFVGAVMLLSSPADELPPATTPPTTQAVTPTTVAVEEAVTEPTTATVPPADEASVAFVDGLIAELNAGDFASARARVLAADVVQSQGLVNDPRMAVVLMFEQWTYLDSEFAIDSCKTLSSGVTRCVFARTSPFESFHPLAETSTVQVRMADGHAAFFTIDPALQDPWGKQYQAFREWMLVENSGAATAIFGNAEPAIAAELIKEYVPLWKATVDG